MNQTPYKYIDDVKVAKALGLASPYARKAHIHTLDGRPLVGGSTLKSIIGNKDMLMQWYADMSAVAGLAMPVQDIKAEYEAVQAITDKNEKMKAKKALDEKYPNYAIARRAAVEHRDAAADEGTANHLTLQDYVTLCIKENSGAPMDVNRDDPLLTKELLSFVDWSLANVKRFYFTEAHCYHGILWVGGIADIGMELLDGRRLVGDHKRSKEVYQDQFLQCAIYDVLLAHSGGLDRDGNKLFDWEPADGYVVFPFRSQPFTPEFRWNAVDFRRGVESLADLYKLMEINN